MASKGSGGWAGGGGFLSSPFSRPSRLQAPGLGSGVEHVVRAVDAQHQGLPQPLFDKAGETTHDPKERPIKKRELHQLRRLGAGNKQLLSWNLEGPGSLGVGKRKAAINLQALTMLSKQWCRLCVTPEMDSGFPFGFPALNQKWLPLKRDPGSAKWDPCKQAQRFIAARKVH